MKFESLKEVEKQLARDYMKKWPSLQWCEVAIFPIESPKFYKIGFLLYDSNYGLQNISYELYGESSLEDLYNNISHEIELG